MGGWHGFGPVVVDDAGPVFHARWEARVFGIVQSLPGANIDAGRHAIERLDPVAYLRAGYYGRWLAALEHTLLGLGVMQAGEVEARIRAPKAPLSRDSQPTRWTPPPPVSYARAVDRAPRFRVGQTVRTRNHQPPGHTRLPAYARCKVGVVEHAHPAMVYPDDHAHARGENPHFLYTVRFAGEELWGPEAEAGTIVHLDLFEPYLEPA